MRPVFARPCTVRIRPQKYPGYWQVQGVESALSPGTGLGIEGWDSAMRVVARVRPWEKQCSLLSEP
jgi:hypothetical protein